MAKSPKARSNGHRPARKYKHPPIEEALCEFQFSPDEALDPMLVVGKLHSEISDEYPGPTRRQNVQTVTVAESQTQVRDELFRIQLPNVDGTRLISVGKNALSISVLRPYVGWEEDFKPRIERALLAYQKVIKPREVRRIGVRYINRISIAQPIADAATYFTNPNCEDKILRLELKHFAKRLEYATSDATKVIITHATIVPNKPEHSDFLLDIDVVRENATINIDNAMSVASELHEKEGEVFESLVTNAARKLFDAPQA
jgi:uncharacterized protein (TIGR04255 family)